MIVYSNKKIKQSPRFRFGALLVLVALFIISGGYIIYNSFAGGSASSVITTAKSKLGARYVWSTEGPSTFDCSGLVYWAYQKQNGVNLGGRQTAQDYSKRGTSVDRSSLVAGDLVFFDENKDGVMDHIAISLGGEQFIQASGSYGKVLISNFSNHLGNKDTHQEDTSRATYNQIYAKARRVIGTNTPATTNSHPTVKNGSSGSAVTELQKHLNTLTYGNLTVDGQFGSGTEKAVKAFQKAKGLTTDGVVGPKTWDSIEAAISALQRQQNLI